MAERRATNKYYPPDWDSTKGSINKRTNSHPLRKRASKIDEGILVIRFEMPFNVWCLKCNNHIGMGVRFNAEKSRVGSYYTSPIYKFRMKCHLCDNFIEIQTDPSKFDYVILAGARKQSKPPDTEETDLVSGEDDETKRKMADAMSRLERKVEDEIQAKSQLPNLHELKQWRSRWEDNFSANQLVRSHYRERRKVIEKNKEQTKKLQIKASLKIAIAKSIPEDKLNAKTIICQSRAVKLDELEKSKKQRLLKSPALNLNLSRTKTSIKSEISTSNGDTNKSTRQSLRIKREPT